MHRHRWGAVAVLAILALPAPHALAHEGNPDYRSQVDRIDPATPGVEARVIGFDDRLELENRSDETIVVKGYEGEPYLLFAPNGEVRVNTRSPAYYLNRDRFADTEVGDEADPKATPRWRTAAGEGVYSWHDHRAHYMSRGTPSQVEDEGERTKVFDYRVPIEVDNRPGEIAGTLYWAGDADGDGGFPLAAVLAGVGAIVVLAGAIAIVLMRRRRSVADTSREAKDAW